MKKKESDIELKPSEKKGRKPKVEKKHYVDAKRFSQLIEEYYKSDIITDELAECISKIANRMAYMPNFINYSYREEMTGDALIKSFQALQDKKFKPELGNAFSYFSRVCFHAFLNRIKQEKKEHEAIQEYKTEVYRELVESNIIQASDVSDESENYDD